MASTVRPRRKLDIQKTAQEINHHVQEVVSLGSTNKNASYTAIQGFTALLNAITQAQKKFPSAFPSGAKNFPWKHAVISALPLSEITRFSELQWKYIKMFCSAEDLRKLTGNLHALAPVLAYYKYEYELPSEVVNCMDAFNEIKYQSLFKQGVRSDEDHSTRVFFIKQTIEQTLRFSLSYGVGNCDPMTDVALLEALWRKLPAAYVQFTGEKVEELNALAIGAWPNAGSYLIIPWAGERGEVFRWNGSIEETPEFRYTHNNVRTIFSVKESAEIISFHKLLKANNYSDWLALPARQENLLEVYQHKKDFFDFMVRMKEIKIKTVNLPQEEARVALASVGLWAAQLGAKKDIILDYLEIENKETAENRLVDISTLRAIPRRS